MLITCTSTRVKIIKVIIQIDLSDVIEIYSEKYRRSWTNVSPALSGKKKKSRIVSSRNTKSRNEMQKNYSFCSIKMRVFFFWIKSNYIPDHELTKFLRSARIGNIRMHHERFADITAHRARWKQFAQCIAESLVTCIWMSNVLALGNVIT